MTFFAGMSPVGRHGNPVAIGSVTNSTEFMRIYALPRRPFDPDRPEYDVTSLFAKPGGKLTFRPIQSAALVEAAKADGLFAPIGVGFGKSLIALALPTALCSERAVILVPPRLKVSLERDSRNFYGKHFHLLLDRIQIVAYSQLSSPKNALLLDELQPDLIVADEAHRLRHRDSVRTRRFLRYMKEHPECRFAALSGTMTTRSIKDYAHLIELALRKNSPLPRGYHEVNDWAGAIDVEPAYVTRPGVLLRFCKAKETVRQGFRRRMVDTQGVAATAEGYVGQSLIIRKRMPSPSPDLEDLIDEVRKHWRIEDDEIADPLEYTRTLKQLAQGFYYRWRWPNGVVDYEWLEARSLWNKEVREKLKHPVKGIDSPMLLARAAERFFQSKGEPQWESEAWAAWREVKDRKPPPIETNWVDDFLIDDAIAWAHKKADKEDDVGTIIWYESSAVGRRLSEKGKLPLYGPDSDAELATAPIIVCSIKTQGDGKNLQHRYSRNLFMTFPPNGAIAEQTMGRTHRDGQEADEVTVDWYGHTPELEGAMVKALADAHYLGDTQGKQKLLYATHL